MPRFRFWLPARDRDWTRYCLEHGERFPERRDAVDARVFVLRFDRGDITPRGFDFILGFKLVGLLFFLLV